MRGGTILFLLLFGGAWASLAVAGEPHKHGAPTHGEHRTPEGWTFTLPLGDRQKGREVFIAMECYKCHAVQGERFPANPADTGGVGPDLSSMGGMHPPEYFAESIVNPNAVLTEGPGYIGEDGRSKMPSYNEILTVEQMIDLVAYLKSLTGPPAGPPATSPGAQHRH